LNFGEGRIKHVLANISSGQREAGRLGPTGSFLGDQFHHGQDVSLRKKDRRKPDHYLVKSISIATSATNLCFYYVLYGIREKSAIAPTFP